MKNSDLVFVGIRGSVVALNRSTGEKVWTTRLKGMSFVNVLVEDDQLFAVTYGEIFCLDPVTGTKLWHNPLKGLGIDLATIATASKAGSIGPAAAAEKQRGDQTATNSAIASAT